MSDSESASPVVSPADMAAFRAFQAMQSQSGSGGSKAGRKPGKPVEFSDLPDHDDSRHDVLIKSTNTAFADRNAKAKLLPSTREYLAKQLAEQYGQLELVIRLPNGGETIVKAKIGAVKAGSLCYTFEKIGVELCDANGRWIAAAHSSGPIYLMLDCFDKVAE